MAKIVLNQSYCLLYTSDAADDSLRVDLGGRRIIKKKKKKKNKTTRVCVLFFFFCLFFFCFFFFFFFQAEDGIRDRSPSRGLGDVYKRQVQKPLSRHVASCGQVEMVRPQMETSK